MFLFLLVSLSETYENFASRQGLIDRDAPLHIFDRFLFSSLIALTKLRSIDT